MRDRGPVRRRTLLVTATAAAVASVCWPLAAAAELTIYPVVRTGDQLPDVAPKPIGGRFVFFSAPSINAGGTVAFRSQAEGFRIYTGLPGQVAAVAPGNLGPADLPAGSTFSIPDDVIPINAGGTVAYSSSYSVPSPGTGGTGAFANPGGVLQSVVLPGDPLVGHPTGGTFGSFGTNSNPVLLADNGTIAYNAWTSTFPNAGKWGIWAGSSKAGMAKIALAGDAAPTLGPDVFFDAIDYPVLNPSGVVAFRATVTGPGTNFDNRDGVWAGAAGDVKPVVRSDTLAPGTASKFTRFGDPAIGRGGKVAFHGSLDFSEAFEQREGIWAGTAGSLSLIARAGTDAPGATGAKFGPFIDDPLINGNGTVSFSSPLSGPGVSTTTNGRGLWIGGDADSLTLVARTGDHAPGTPDGVTFAWPSDYAHALNDLGQVAFTATVDGPGVDFSNDVGLWVYDPIHGTRLVAREGQTLQVGQGATRTIDRIELLVGAATGDGRATGLNDAGQVAFAASFKEGIFGGVFVADVGGTLPGDVDANGTVNDADRALVQARLGQAGGYAFGDFDLDGLVTAADVGILERHFGRTLAAFSPETDLRFVPVAPEPTALVWAAAAAALLRRGRRGRAS
jgi:hypothetical protein